MKKDPTIIFISGFLLPNFIGQSSLMWNDKFWQDYNRVYLNSKIPTSDIMVSQEIEELVGITSSFSNVVLAGQSLGGWWAANVACHAKCKINKLVLWTPLADTQFFPMFNATALHFPRNKNPTIFGPNKTLTISANNDWIVPHFEHSYQLEKLFLSSKFILNGGHYYQDNHQQGLEVMKKFINQ